MGKILRVNLTNGKTMEEPLSEDVARKYVGGKALSAKILFDELRPSIDPLGPGNKMIVATALVRDTLLGQYSIFCVRQVTLD